MGEVEEAARVEENEMMGCSLGIKEAWRMDWARKRGEEVVDRRDMVRWKGGWEGEDGKWWLAVSGDENVRPASWLGHTAWLLTAHVTTTLGLIPSFSPSSSLELVLFADIVIDHQQITKRKKLSRV